MAWQDGDSVIVNGFGYEGVDGTYYYFIDSKSGDEYFIKDRTSKVFFIQRHPVYMPYIEEPRYYILKVFKIRGSIPITKPLYVSLSDSITSGWTSLQDPDLDLDNSSTPGEVFDKPYIWEQQYAGEPMYAVFENNKYWRLEQ
jgi:hypothetical protein